ncbi:MAG TPA: hypothetical protein VLJ76_10470, partial [Gaiellaceae bacterium]|nr:hypothetical protein [Gaiellaceae bacterium]
MRRLLLLAGILVVVPAAAARPDDNPPPPPTTTAAPALTLTAPGATTYGHQIDMIGTLSPAAAGMRVRLLRGTTFVTATTTTATGAFRFKVAIANPGPFHAEAAGVSSPPVTVRIVPFLDATLVGARVAGSPLSLSAKLQPSYAGTIRVRVVRSGGRRFSQVFGSNADVALGTSAIESFQVVVDELPNPGFVGVSKTLAIT